MKKLFYFLPILVSTIFMVGCSVSMDKETEQALKVINSGYENEGKEFVLTGYMGVPRTIIVTGDNITINLYNSAGQNDNSYFAKLDIPFGQGPNSYYVPKKYRGSDVEIYDNDGNKHGYMAKVKVTGTVHYTDKNWKESIDKEITRDKLDNDFLYKNRLERQEKAKTEAAEREKNTGDPNDYSFKLVVSKISVE